MRISSLTESKLSKKDRDKLNPNDFGLPEKRKFPLNDKRHVFSAIKFFRYCPPKDRAELANNIIKKAKEFNISINVSEDNPLSKYVKGNKVVESTINPKEPFSENEAVLDRIGVSTTIPEFQKALNWAIEDPNSLFNFQRYMNDTIDRNMELLKDYDEKDAFIKAVASVVNHKYGDYMKFVDYDNNANQTELYSIVLDMINATNKKNGTKTIAKIVTDNYNDSLNTNEKSYLYYQLLTPDMERPKIDSINENSFDMLNILNALENSIRKSGLFKNERIPSPITEAYHEEKYHTLKEELKSLSPIPDIQICMINDTNYPPTTFPLIRKLNGIFKSFELRNGIGLESIDFYLDGLDLVMLGKLSYKIQSICKFTDYEGRVFYGAYIDGSEYIIGKDIHNNRRYNFMKIGGFGEDATPYLDTEEWVSMQHILPQARGTRPLCTSIAREGLEVDKAGNVKFTFPKDRKYMDLYMENHKMMQVAIVNNAIDSLKPSVAYSFALLRKLEHDKKYGNKDPELIKARAFIINDFKTGYKKLIELEPTFDFSDYYEKNNFNKYVVDIPIDTIEGIKKILKTILI